MSKRGFHSLSRAFPLPRARHASATQVRSLGVRILSRLDCGLSLHSPWLAPSTPAPHGRANAVGRGRPRTARAEPRKAPRARNNIVHDAPAVLPRYVIATLVIFSLEEYSSQIVTLKLESNGIWNLPLCECDDRYKLAVEDDRLSSPSATF